MTTWTKLSFTWMLMAAMCLLPLLYGCQEEGLPDEEGAEVSLTRVPTNPDYAFLPLIGTAWKLIGFVDKKKNRIRIVKAGDGDSFTQVFEDNGRFTGRASINQAQGEYSMTKDHLSIQQYHLLTEAGESPDGYLYIAAMEKVFAYRISNRGLELYYDPQQYLLFQPME